MRSRNVLKVDIWEAIMNILVSILHIDIILIDYVI